MRYSRQRKDVKMRVDVFINDKAGNTRHLDLVTPVTAALSESELFFHFPRSLPEMPQLLNQVLERGTDCLTVCGGDGTLNSLLSTLVERLRLQKKLPPVSIIPTGTANDLASGFGISKDIASAARSAFEGKIKNVDVLEITSEHQKSYMLTNGGMGIPAETAYHANRAKTWSQSKSPCTLPRIFHPLTKAGKILVSKIGPKIYEAMLVRELYRWKNDSWEVTLESPNAKPFTTNAPMILINNQSTIGGSFIPAPNTLNHDGNFNVFLLNSNRFFSQIKNVLSIKNGTLPGPEHCSSFETSEIKFRAHENAKPITFFGDGEIMHKDIRELNIRCIHPGIPLLIK